MQPILLIYRLAFLLFCFVFFEKNTIQAASITAVASGYWTNNATWDCNCQPVAGDMININSGFVVMIPSSTTINFYTGLEGTTTIINLNGTGELAIEANSSLLYLSATSQINLNSPSAEINPPNKNEDVTISIGGAPCGLAACDYENGELGELEPPISLTSLGALPVELKSFSVRETVAGLLLEWVTATEIDNDFFVVEKSTDGFAFSAISKVKAAGTSLLENHYEFADRNPQPVNYYRLKQVDYDGRFEYSQIVSLVTEGVGEPFVVAPNPVAPNAILTVLFSKENEGEGHVSLTDRNGKLVYSQKMDLTGRQEFSLPDLPGGVYFIKVQMPNEVRYTRLVVR